MAKLIGYQIANEKGENIQGDGVCPVDFASFEVLNLAAAHQVMNKLSEMNLDGKYLLQPIVEGDVEEYEMIDKIDYIADVNLVADTNTEFVVLVGCEGEEDQPIYCPNVPDKDATVTAAENRGEFCVVYELPAIPSYTTV